MPTYTGHLQNYFGGDPQAYAEAIKQKQKSGQAFSDPAAAQAFQQAFPNLFAAPTAPQPQTAQLAPAPQTVNSANEQKYLQGLIDQSPGNAGLTDWAKQQARQLGVNLTLPAAPAPTVSAPPVTQQQAPQPSQVSPIGQQAYQEGGLLGLTQAAQAQQTVLDTQKQLKQLQEQGFDFTKSQFYPMYQNLAQTLGDEASGRAMEELNARGILNSTITADRVAQAQQEAMARAFPGIFQMAQQEYQSRIGNMFDILGLAQGQIGGLQERAAQAEQTAYTRQEAEQKEAFRQQLEIEKLILDTQKANLERGLKLLEVSEVVTDEIAILTGLPVGMLSSKARQAINDSLVKIEIARMNNENALAVEQTRGQYDVAQEKIQQAGQTDRTSIEEQGKIGRLQYEMENKPQDLAAIMKNGILEKVYTSGIDSLTDNEKAVAPTLGIRLTQDEDKLSKLATNEALAAFITLTPGEQESYLSSQELMERAAGQGIDVDVLWDAYNAGRSGDKLSSTATNDAVAAFVGLSKKKQKAFLESPELKGLAASGVDINKLWQIYNANN